MSKLADFIKTFEGCKLHAYQDIVGVWTCGYGSTGPDICAGTIWTPWQAEQRLEQDLEKFQKGVKALVSVSLNENQLDALTSFAYNLGLSSLKHSHLLTYVNSENFKAAADEFLKWDHAGGVQVLGLTKRRKAERDLFLS